MNSNRKKILMGMRKTRWSERDALEIVNGNNSEIQDSQRVGITKQNMKLLIYFMESYQLNLLFHIQEFAGFTLLTACKAVMTTYQRCKDVKITGSNIEEQFGIITKRAGQLDERIVSNNLYFHFQCNTMLLVKKSLSFQIIDTP